MTNEYDQSEINKTIKNAAANPDAYIGIAAGVLSTEEWTSRLETAAQNAQIAFEKIAPVSQFSDVDDYITSLDAAMNNHNGIVLLAIDASKNDEIEKLWNIEYMAANNKIGEWVNKNREKIIYMQVIKDGTGQCALFNMAPQTPGNPPAP